VTRGCAHQRQPVIEGRRSRRACGHRQRPASRLQQAAARHPPRAMSACYLRVALLLRHTGVLPAALRFPRVSGTLVRSLRLCGYCNPGA
jgi:hypothetical protein